VSGFLLDTNIPSELIRTRPTPKVADWFYAQDESTLYLSVVTIGELRKGFSLLAVSSRRAQLEQWFDSDLIPLFYDRILPVTYLIAEKWGDLDAQGQKSGTPLNTADGMIAATALITT
jgi:predicted nucleic acid-binding protein